MTRAGEGDDLVNELKEDIPAQRVERRPKVFRGYHKPRKHWMRIHQWCALLRNLLVDSPPTGGRPVSYLGLPGDDLLDIRTIYGVCERAGFSLRYLGFNSGAANAERRADLDVSISEVNRLERVDPASEVVADRLESLSNQGSIAFRKVINHGPFSVVNLDLCDSIAKYDPSEGPSYFAALNELVVCQLSRMADPWLLFITTRADAEAIHPACMALLVEPVVVNCGDSTEFDTVLVGLLENRITDLKNQLQSLDEIRPEVLRNLVAIALAKWLLSVATPQGSRWSVELLTSYIYTVKGGAPDMLSLAFRFRPHPFQGGNSFGLGVTTSKSVSDAAINPIVKVAISEDENVLPSSDAQTSGNSDVPAIAVTQGDLVDASELNLAMKMLEGVQQFIDVDTLLANDPTAMSKIIRQASRLLSQARYSEAEFTQWVERGCPTDNG